MIHQIVSDMNLRRANSRRLVRVTIKLFGAVVESISACGGGKFSPGVGNFCLGVLNITKFEGRLFLISDHQSHTCRKPCVGLPRLLPNYSKSPCAGRGPITDLAVLSALLFSLAWSGDSLAWAPNHLFCTRIAKRFCTEFRKQTRAAEGSPL